MLTADIVGGGSFATIQQAINNAAPGDQINITPGFYAENIDLSGMGSAIGQGTGDLTLRGVGAGVTINPASGRAMINSSAFAGDLTIDTIGFTSQTDTGLDLDQYSGTLNITNSIFDAAQENGIELSNAMGSISIVDSQVIDMGNKGIRLDTVENVLIDNVTIDGGGAGNKDGIFGRDVSGVEIRNSTIRDIGDGVAHDAIDLKDTLGTVIIRDNSFERIGDDAVQIETNGTIQAAVTVSGNTVLDSILGGGIELRTNDDAIVDATISDNTLDGLDDHAIELALKGASHMTAVVSNNVVANTGVETAIIFEAEDSSMASITTIQNSISDTGGNGIRADARDTSELDVVIRWNVLSEIGDNSGDNAIQLQSSQGATILALVDQNEVDTVQGIGLYVRGLGDSTQDVIATNNRLSNTNLVSGAAAVLIDDEDPGDATVIRLDLRGNQQTNAGSADAYQLNQRGSGIFDIVGVEATATEVVENNNVGTPVTVTGTINVVAPPPPSPSFVDANNDGQFTAGVDVALNLGELSDGSFDTLTAEGGYTTVIAGAGLVINGASITGSGDLKFRADGDLVVNTDLTAGDDIRLTSRAGSVLLDDPAITAADDIEIEAALDILSTDDVIEATGAGSEVELKAGRNILLFGTSVEAVREVELEAGESIIVGDSLTLPGLLTASDPAKGEVELEAGLDINVSAVNIDAGKEIELKAGRDIFAVDAVMTALGSSKGEVELKAAGDIDIAGAALRASDEVELTSTGGEITATNAAIEALGSSKGEVELKAAGDINVDGAGLFASRELELESTGGEITAVNAVMEALGSSKGEVELKAAGDINVDGARLFASRELELESTGGKLSAVNAVMEALGSSKGEVELKATGDINIAGAALSASDEVEVTSRAGRIFADAAVILASEAELEAALDIHVVGAILPLDTELKAGGTIFGP